LRKEQRRQRERQRESYYTEQDTHTAHREDPNGQRRKKRGHRRRADDTELIERQEQKGRQHRELQREEEEQKEKEKAKRRKQAEVAAAVEAMREVFGQERDEKLLTIWLAEGMHDVAAAINIGLAHDQRAKEQRERETERDTQRDTEDPIDAALDGIALKLAETVHTERQRGTEEDMDPEEQAALEALHREVEAFDSALDTHTETDKDRQAAEKRARKEERRRKKEAKKEAERAAERQREEKRDASPAKAKKKLGMFGRMFGKKNTEKDTQKETRAVTDADESDRGAQGVNTEESGGLAVGDPCEVYSQSQEAWVAGSVTEVGSGQVAVQYGEKDRERQRAIDLADPHLSEYFRAPNLKDVRQTERERQYAVGEPCEIYSESQGAWLAGVIIEVKKNKVAVEYGERMRVVDVTDPKLFNYFKPRPQAQFQVGDPCEVYSRSAESWQEGVVTEVKRHKIAVEYGDRTRAIDLTDPELSLYFRALPAPLSGVFVVGDTVEMYSQSIKTWVNGTVIEVKGQKLAVEYGDRMRVVDLADPQLKEYFRSDKLRSDTEKEAQRATETHPKRSTERGGSAVGLAAILRQDPNSAFAVAQERLRQRKQEIETMETHGFK
jgi:hypothetical protein